MTAAALREIQIDSVDSLSGDGHSFRAMVPAFDGPSVAHALRASLAESQGVPVEEVADHVVVTWTLLCEGDRVPMAHFLVRDTGEGVFVSGFAFG